MTRLGALYPMRRDLANAAVLVQEQSRWLDPKHPNGKRLLKAERLIREVIDDLAQR